MSNKRGASAVIQKASFSKPVGWIATDSFQSCLLHDIRYRVGDPFGQERFAVGPRGRFLRGEGEKRALGMDDAVSDLHFLVSFIKASPTSGLCPLRFAEPRINADQ